MSEVFVMRNLTPRDVEESVADLAGKIANAQILAIPGGFSSGDEPDGSASSSRPYFAAIESKRRFTGCLGSGTGWYWGFATGSRP